MSVKARVSVNLINTKAHKMQKKTTQPVVKMYQSDSDSKEEEEVSNDEHSEEEDEVEEDDGLNVEEEEDEEEVDEDAQNSDDSDDDDDEPEDDDHDADNSDDGDDEAQAGDSDGDGPQSGWADAMAKVLNTGKTKEASSLFLSKARMDSEWKRKSADDNKDNESGEPEQKKSRPPSALAKRLQRKEIESKCRSKPAPAAEPGSAEARAAEKQLGRLATRGVVQFFNAVRDHQKTLKTELSAVGGSVRKREKVMRQMADRDGFMQTLAKSDKGTAKGVVSQKSQEVKQEQEESSWNILREDFMMGAKMRDWDKESDGE